MSNLKIIDKGKSVFSLDPHLQKSSNLLKLCQKMGEKRFLVENSTHLKHFQTLHGKKLWIKAKFMNVAFKTNSCDKKIIEN
jgi:hypothetical protein